MIKSGNSTVQRVQVGLIGLLAVLLFVSIADVMIERALPSQADKAGSENAGVNPPPADAEAATDEPLAELGVTPTVTTDTATPAPDLPKNDAKVSPTQ